MYGSDTGPFQRQEGGIPGCLAGTVANPSTVGRGKGDARGSVFRSLPALPQDEGNWPAIRRWVGRYVCPPLATLSRDVRPEPWGDGIHTAVELWRGTHRVLLGRVAMTVPTRP